ncbi:S41 family peptidase [Stieleria varia]|uniref:Putative CtpA-like serine protease n=1 Tax=Stieleria varia TaxID=2528005 RepID=A0A5C6ARX8_9BACT|nr:S41 family peptidase [Stieleria varia]TWU00924.1 putative CtpA-like serine protease [Stieleria varia]
MPSRNLNVIFFAAVMAILCYATHRRARTAIIVGEAIDLIDQRYVDDVDPGDLVIAAMDGLTKSLDQHSSYFPVDAYESFQESINQEFAGIGIFVEQPDPEKPVRVITPVVGSPALEKGVLPGDEIIRVDGVDVSKMNLKDVSSRLKGPPGTIVLLGMRRGEGEVSMEVTRARIEMESVIGDHRGAGNEWVYRLEDQPRVAYIRLKSFGDKTVREVEDVLTALDNDFDSLVLDLRGNSGGLLYAACDICDMFMDSGKIVSTKMRGGVEDSAYSATPGTLVDSSKPVAVLIDHDSASASEIVAACLQDNKRAIVVGTRSYGKGTVQEILPLQFGRSALRLTVARYYRPNNQNIHRADDATEDDVWGVKPDEGFLIPMTREELIALNDRWMEASYPMLGGAEKLATDVHEDQLPVLEPREIPVKDAGAESGDAASSVAESESEESEKTEPPFEISPESQARIDAGPESLRFDPPLRAAVGELLNRTGRPSDQVEETPAASESEPRKNAA